MKSIVLITTCILLLLTGCESATSKKGNNGIKPIQIEYSNERADLYAFALTEEGNYFASAPEQALRLYSPDGAILKEYPQTGFYSAMCVSGNDLYAYEPIKSQLIRFAVETGEIVELAEFQALQVRDMAVSDDKLVIIAITGTDLIPYYYDDDYIDMGEKLYLVDTKTGEVTATGETNVIALYSGTGAEVYLYSYADGNYSLSSLDVKTETSKKTADMNDTGYLTAFIYENGAFSYLKSNELWMMKTLKDTPSRVRNGITLNTGNNMQFYRGNIVYLTFLMHDNANAGEMSLTALRSVFPDAPEDEVTLKISGQGRNGEPRSPFKLDVMKNTYGMNALFTQEDTYSEKFILDLLAGSQDIDIYVLSASAFNTQKLRKGGAYVPLTDSGAVRSLIDGSFPYVADWMYNDGNEIWAIPAPFDVFVTWYIPDNMERNGVSPDDILYFDGYIETLSRLYDQDPFFHAYANHSLLTILLESQYDLAYNDFPNKKVNYVTELFTSYFTTVYDNSPAHAFYHPLIRNSWVLNAQSNGIIKDSGFGYDKSTLIFKQESLFSHMNDPRVSDLSDWRVMPMPRLTEQVTWNINAGLLCAFVNPKSTHKEKAVEFLETVARDPWNTYVDPAFFMKDETLYSAYLDPDLPIYNDIYEIYEDIAIIAGIRPSYSATYITEYMQGKLTAEEAISILQRETEFWLNE